MYLTVIKMNDNIKKENDSDKIRKSKIIAVIFFLIFGYFFNYLVPLAVFNGGWFIMASIWGLYGVAHGWKIFYELFFK